jgi:hypothetical protein
MTSPRCSIITYNHDPVYLLKVWNYLKVQKSLNSWEWIIGYTENEDGNSSWARIKQLSIDTPNISLLQIPQGKDQATGYFLNVCADKAKGDLLAFLFDNALPSSTLILQLSNPYKFDFLYGDFAFYANNKPVKDPVFKEPFWESYEHLENEDGTYLVYIAPPVQARTLQESKLSPKGILIWKKEIFSKLNGFNSNLGEGCDHELMCRTYVTGYDMVHTNFCFSYIEYIPEDKEQTSIYTNISHQFFYHLINEDVRRHGSSKFELSIYPKKTSPGFEKIEWTGAQLIDTNTCKSIPDNSVGLINATDYLHLIPQNQIIALMEAIWKILMPGGWFISATPSTRGAGAFSDPRQASYWNSLSFSFFCLAKEMSLDFGFSGLFQHTRVWENFPSAWHKQNEVLYVQADLMKLKVNL